jgi:hypothetical protein
MTDRIQDPKQGAANAAGTSKETDTSSRQSGHTGAGQEAAQGQAPKEHGTERQSKYGGGGENGGTGGNGGNGGSAAGGSRDGESKKGEL